METLDTRMSPNVFPRKALASPVTRLLHVENTRDGASVAMLTPPNSGVTQAQKGVASFFLFGFRSAACEMAFHKTVLQEASERGTGIDEHNHSNASPFV